MNFSTIENSVLEEKKKFSNFLSRFFKNSRILIILLTAAVITAVSISIWIKSPEYQVLYNHLSNEDSRTIINQLNQMKIPYQFTDISGQISVPKEKIYEIRLHLAENNLPRDRGVGFELLDKEKFGISQFNEQINYQRALEGELARTIQRIDSIKNARIHIAFAKSSLFLQDKKKPSASVVLEIKPGRILDADQINAILHLISSSVSDLSIKDITVVDQLGKLLNQPSLRYDQVNNLQFKYSEDIESHYINRIKNILEPLVGKGNIYAQVTAQIDFNSQEKTQEKYSPNTDHANQAIRSHQISIHDQKKKENIQEQFPSSFNKKDNFSKNNKISQHKDVPFTNINHDSTINYELNHSVSHTKINIGKIKRLSAAVVINFIKDKNGKALPLNIQKIKNIKNLVREAIGYSHSRGDSIHIVNALFAKNNQKIPVQFNTINTFKLSNFLFNLAPWFFSFILFVFFLKKYIRSYSERNNLKDKIIKDEKKKLEKHIEKHIESKNDLTKNINTANIQNNLNKDKLIDQICNISNQNPRTIALIIRKWMSDKI